MPETGVESVPLARVYDALDGEAYRAFRVAMRRSRGGVVRVDDLVAGLAEVSPQATVTAFGLSAADVAGLTRPPATEPDLVPMANEPALRALLTGAYRRASGQHVTPGHLLAALSERQPLSALFHRARSIPISTPPRFPSGPTGWTGEQAAATLGAWLAAQSLSPPEREAEVAKISIGPGGQTPSRD